MKSQNTITCQCGHCVVFQDDDRGFEVYCPSCARACNVPEATTIEPTVDTGGAPMDSLTRIEGSRELRSLAANVSVFVTAGEEQVSDRIVDEIPCFCGENVPVRIEDFGETVYCPKCSTGLLVGETLVNRQVRLATTSMDDSPNVAEAKPRRLLSKAALAMLFILLVGCVAVAYFAARRTLPTFYWSGTKATAPIPQAPDESAKFDPNSLTPAVFKQLEAIEHPLARLTQAIGWREQLTEAKISDSDLRFARLKRLISTTLEEHARMIEIIDDLPSARNPERALLDAELWARAFDLCQLPESDERPVRLAEVIRELTERADPITLDMIRQLLLDPDTEGALIKAQLWQEELRHRGATRQDPRIPELARAEIDLRERLIAADQRIDEVIQEFRRAVDLLGSQLRKRQYSKAIEQVDVIEAMLLKHPDSLNRLTARFLQLRKKAIDAGRREKGYQQVTELLMQSKRIADSGDSTGITEALVHWGQAQFIFIQTPMTAERQEELTKKADELKPLLRLAQGRRAVEDAEQCERHGDTLRRNYEVRRAMALLPGFPESKIQQLLTRIEPWQEDAKKESKGKTPISLIQQRLRRRDILEAAFEALASGDLDLVLLKANHCHRELHGDAAYSDYLEDLDGFTLELLETQCMEIVERIELSASEDRPRHIGAASSLLRRSENWSHTAQWKRLNGILAQYQSDAARDALKRSQKLAEQGDLDGALEAANDAMDMADQQTHSTANSQVDAVKEELEIRKSAIAEEAAFLRIQRLRRRRETGQCWSELLRFQKRYPNSKFSSQVAEQLQSVRDYSVKYRDRLRASVQQLMVQTQWSEAIHMLELLQSVPQIPTDDLQSHLDLQRLKARSKLRLMLRGSTRLTREQVLEAYKVAELLLTLNPSDSDAQQLQTQAQARGRTFAEYLVDGYESATDLQRKLPARIKNLHKAVALDPKGAFGKRAKELLAKAEK